MQPPLCRPAHRSNRPGVGQPPRYRARHPGGRVCRRRQRTISAGASLRSSTADLRLNPTNLASSSFGGRSSSGHLMGDEVRAAKN